MTHAQGANPLIPIDSIIIRIRRIYFSEHGSIRMVLNKGPFLLVLSLADPGVGRGGVVLQGFKFVQILNEFAGVRKGVKRRNSRLSFQVLSDILTAVR